MNRWVYWVLGAGFGLGSALNLTLLFYPAESSPLRYLAIGCVQGLIAGWLISSGNDAARRAKKAGHAPADRPAS
jgi:high-affinity Fe2+/Pb2+ permease